MKDKGSYLCGDMAFPKPKEQLAALLRDAGLSVTVGAYAVTLDDCSHFRFQEYGGDICDPCVDADADTVEEMIRDAELVSGALIQANVGHCFEIYDGEDRLVTTIGPPSPLGD